MNRKNKLKFLLSSLIDFKVLKIPNNFSKKKKICLNLSVEILTKVKIWKNIYKGVIQNMFEAISKHNIRI